MPFPKGAPRPPGAGRKKGSKNKLSGELKDMILTALDESGGVKYLVKQAEETPTAFLALVGKVLPLTIKGAGENGEFVVLGAWQKSAAFRDH